MPELRGQCAEIAPRPVALNCFNQSTRRMRAEIVEGVRRQDRAIEGRRIGSGLGQPELMRDAVSLPDAVPAILSLAEVETVEMRKRDDGFGFAIMVLQRHEPYGLRLEVWTPE